MPIKKNPEVDVPKDEVDIDSDRVQKQLKAKRISRHDILVENGKIVLMLSFYQGSLGVTSIIEGKLHSKHTLPAPTVIHLDQASVAMFEFKPQEGYIASLYVYNNASYRFEGPREQCE